MVASAFALSSAKAGSGGGNRTRALTAYEAVALPLGDPAVVKVARRLGAAPSERGFGDQAAQAGARRVEENGAASRNCTDIT